MTQLDFMARKTVFFARDHISQKLMSHLFSRRSIRREVRSRHEPRFLNPAQRIRPQHRQPEMPRENLRQVAFQVRAEHLAHTAALVVRDAPNQRVPAALHLHAADGMDSIVRGQQAMEFADVLLGEPGVVVDGQ